MDQLDKSHRLRFRSEGFSPVNYTMINKLTNLKAILVNEVHGRRFPCASFVPTTPFQSGSSFVCTVRGAVAGDLEVSGDAWVQSSYQYSYSHIWRNLGS